VLVKSGNQVESIKKHPSILRYYLYLAYLREHPHAFSRVLISDTRDVVFQANPFLEQWPYGIHCFFESKEVSIGTESFTKSWVQYLFGEDVLDHLQDLPVSCSGVSLGSLQPVINYLEAMTKILDCSSVDLSRHGLDQGAHNYLVHNRLSPSIHMHNDCSWLVATISGFRKINAIHFDRSLNVLRPSSQIAVPILHQYDRVPSLLWKWNRREYFVRLIHNLKVKLLTLFPGLRSVKSR